MESETTTTQTETPVVEKVKLTPEELVYFWEVFGKGDEIPRVKGGNEYYMDKCQIVAITKFEDLFSNEAEPDDKRQGRLIGGEMIKDLAKFAKKIKREFNMLQLKSGLWKVAFTEDLYLFIAPRIGEGE